MKFTLSSLRHASLALVLAFTLPSASIAATKSAAGDVDCQLSFTFTGEMNFTVDMILLHHIVQTGKDYEVTVTFQELPSPGHNPEAQVYTYPAKVKSTSKEHTLTYLNEVEKNIKLIYPPNGGKAQLFYQDKESGKWVNLLNSTFKDDDGTTKFLGQCNYTPAQ